MPKINEYFNVGDRENIDVERLLVIMEDMYRELAVAINKKPDIYQRTTNGIATETFLSNGDININTNTNRVEMLTNHTSSSNVTWTTIS